VNLSDATEFDQPSATVSGQFLRDDERLFGAAPEKWPFECSPIDRMFAWFERRSFATGLAMIGLWRRWLWWRLAAFERVVRKRCMHYRDVYGASSQAARDRSRSSDNTPRQRPVLAKEARRLAEEGLGLARVTNGGNNAAGTAQEVPHSRRTITSKGKVQ
jgi:hypothetical protein